MSEPIRVLIADDMSKKAVEILTGAGFSDMSSAMRTRIGSDMAPLPFLVTHARRVPANVACAAATPAPGRMPNPRSDSVISKPEIAVMMSNSLM